MKKLILTIATLSLINLSAQTLDKKESKFSIVPTFGYSWRTAETPSGISADLKNIVDQIKKGTNFDITALYKVSSFGTNQSHVGLKYSRFSSSGSGFVNNGSNNVFVNTEDVIYYIGPVYTYIQTNGKNEFFWDISLGYINYTSISTGISTGKAEGSNLGFSTSFSYLFGISNSITIGPNLSYSGGTITEYDVTANGRTEVLKLEDNEKESLGRISLNIQVRIKL